MTFIFGWWGARRRLGTSRRKSRESDTFVEFCNDFEAYRPCLLLFLLELFPSLPRFPHSTFLGGKRRRKRLTQGTFKMHKSEVFEHLELRVGE